MTPKKEREIVFQLLYSIDIGDSQEGDLVPFLMQELSITRKTVREAHARARAIWERREEFDSLIAATSETYALERIGRVERNILRASFCELLEGTEPYAMSISEAVRLARKFSTPEAARFVNAILDHAALPTLTKHTS